MSKPEDIPQDVWDEAHAVNMDQLWACIPDDPDDVKLYQDTAAIARAILSAEKRGEEREREACAETGRAAVMKFRAAAGKRYYPGYHEDMREAVDAAIRKRGA